jgi:arylsulfatase A-like enzyme
MERVILTGEIVSGHNIQQAGPGMFHRDLRKRTILLMLFGILLFGAAPRMQIASTTIPAASARKPNVLFLFADDMRADSIAALGNPAVKTPNLDAIVRRGFVMSNAYCLGGNIPAVCTPSRNMLLSGNAYFRWRDHVIQRDHVTQKAQGQQRGLLAPGDAPNFPLSLKDAGYVTYHHGKRGNSATLIQAKFEINKYLADDKGDRLDGEPGRQIVDEAIRFLKGKHNEQNARPFFMYLAFANPHDPRVAAKRYLDQYDRQHIPLPKNFRPIHPFDNGEMTVRDELLAPWPRPEAEIRKQLHEYYATITGLDFHIGRLLATLNELGLAEETIIVFSADQGIAIGSHGLLGKQNLYDHSMKAPLFFAGPSIPHGRSDALVYLLDIYPTICDLAGVPLPQGIDGVSFKPVMTGKVKEVRTELITAYRTVQRAYRDRRWKLIRYPQVDVTQLFDLQRDPDELRNLSGDPSQAARVRQLTGRLAELQKRFGDDLPLRVEKPLPPAFKPPTGVALQQIKAKWKID